MLDWILKDLEISMVNGKELDYLFFEFFESCTDLENKNHAYILKLSISIFALYLTISKLKDYISKEMSS